jgi:hypothetical protein
LSGKRPSVTSRISPGSNQADPQEEHTSIGFFPEPAARIESILQKGHRILFIIGNLREKS